MMPMRILVGVLTICVLLGGPASGESAANENQGLDRLAKGLENALPPSGLSYPDRVLGVSARGELVVSVSLWAQRKASVKDMRVAAKTDAWTAFRLAFSGQEEYRQAVITLSLPVPDVHGRTEIRTVAYFRMTRETFRRLDGENFDPLRLAEVADTALLDFIGIPLDMGSPPAS